MIDYHTHILPGIDDGSRDIDMTVKMLEAEAAQGVSHIYATPHFYAHRRSVEFFLERRERALEKVRQALAERPELPKVTAGAEVYYFSGIGRAALLPKLCIEGTDMLLLEMPFGQWDAHMAEEIRAIQRRGLTVALAHVERYFALQKDRRPWEQILDTPVILQMNAESFIDQGSFLRPSKAHKLCLRLLTERDGCILGSDCHNMSDRPPNMAKAIEVIEKKLGREVLDRVTK